MVMFFFFFFQAEDGIRDFHVTGVQTCALPISSLACFDGTGSAVNAASTTTRFGVTVLVMTKDEIANVLEQIATLLELKNENPFKIRAYTNAARAIETFGGNVSNFQDEEALSKIPGIGKSIALKLKELAETGSLKYLEELSAEFPSGILELFSLPGLGAKKIKALYDKLQISSIEQLQKACETGRVAELPGFGETTQQKL